MLNIITEENFIGDILSEEKINEKRNEYVLGFSYVIKNDSIILSELLNCVQNNFEAKVYEKNGNYVIKKNNILIGKLFITSFDTYMLILCRDEDVE